MENSIAGIKKERVVPLLLLLFILVSFLWKLVLIFKYKNLLTLSSDDVNYAKSAVALMKRSIFVFHNYNEPTVFIMPFYPFFLAGVFKIFGYGLVGLQAVRVIQAILSCVTLVYVFLIARKLFDDAIALTASFLVAFYVPNIITPGYILTETLFTLLLYMLLYYSMVYAEKPSYPRFFVLGLIWAAATLCRPTIALYPALLFFVLFIRRIFAPGEIIRFGSVMALSFVLVFAPWWVRNYREYNTFIPLTASTGNPMLQGTYVNYEQTPENITYYKLGENAFETNRTEVEVAGQRIREGFRKDFWGYLRWYTLGKTKLFWGTTFYWKEFFGIPHRYVMASHYFLLIGFAGLLLALLKRPAPYLLPLSVMLYFNVVHCITMAFDRYAFPLIPMLSVFCAFFLTAVFKAVVSLFSNP